MTDTNPSTHSAADQLRDPLDRGLFAGFGPDRRDSTSDGVDDAAPFLEALRDVRSRISLRDARSPVNQRLLKPLADGCRGNAEQIGKYRLLGEVARGGVGVILRAHDMDLGRDIAIKRLRGRYERNPALLQRFVEEAQIAGQLEHPGIVPVYDLGVEEGKPFFAMKLVKGRTLAELLARRSGASDEPRRFLSIFEQICQTIAYAHARGVIHRDLKPGNVMVGAFGEVQVMDWGMGKVLSQEDQESRGADGADIIETIRSIRRNASESQSIVGSVMGTPAYMPPEQARGEVDKMDERSDVFTLGAILLEILTGRAPYAGTERDLLRAAKACELVDVFECLDRSGADAALARLARDCLSDEIAARPVNAEVVATRISSHLTSVEQRVQQARVDAAEARVLAASARKSQRLTLALALAVLLIVAVCAGSYAWIRHDAEVRRTDINQRLERALQEASIAHGRAQVAAIDGPAWTTAMAAANELQVLLESPLIHSDLRARADTFITRVDAEKARATDAAVRARQDTEMVAALEAISLPDDYSIRDDAFFVRDARRRIAAYREAFVDYGVAVDVLPDAEVAKRIRDTDIAVELAAALSDWASMLRRVGEPGTERMHRIAMLADPDEWRTRLRRLYLDAGNLRAKLLALAESADIEALPAITVTSFAAGMFGAGLKKPALALLHRAHQLHPQDFNLSYIFALALEQADPPDYRAAARIYTVARTLRPNNVQVAHRLGVTQMKVGDFRGAVPTLRSVLARKPDLAVAYAALCEAERQSGHNRLAVEAGLEAVRLAPDLAFCKVNCAVALQAVGRSEEAVKMAKTAVRLDPNYATGWCILGLIHIRRNEFAAAIEASRRAAELREGYVQAINNLGYALQRSERYEAAVSQFRLALRLQPSYRRSRQNLAYSLFKAGDREGAMAEVRALLRYHPNSALGHLRLGSFLYEMGKREEGIREFRIAVRLNSRSADYRYRLANALLCAGRHEDAIRAYREATQLDPEHAMAFLELSEALRLTGNIEASQKARKTALRLDPALLEGR